MSGWGISPSASEKEKIKAEWADELNGKNSVVKITYDVYSELFDVGMDLLDKMYELGKSDGGKEGKKGHWLYVSTLDGFRYVRCSVCRCNFDPITGVRHYKYCPYCGTKMEG